MVGDDPVARRDRAILETMYGTGVRISELVGMSLPDVDLHDGLASGDRQEQGADRAARRMAATALVAVRPGGAGRAEPRVAGAWRRRRALFLNQRGRLGRQGVWSVVRLHGAEADCTDCRRPTCCVTVCHPHARPRADIRTVAELPGHASISTTQIYTKVTTARIPRRLLIGPSAATGLTGGGPVMGGWGYPPADSSALRPGGPPEADRAWAESVLSDAEFALLASAVRSGPAPYGSGGARGRAAVGTRRRRRCSAAALLHDIGKIDADLGTWVG
ncbi:MAG: tyrosine-type recombinase/integrase [Acidimicrobiales bacterium]